MIEATPATTVSSSSHGNPWRAFAAMVAFSFRRQARVRQMTGAAFMLLISITGLVALVSSGPVGWSFENRTRGVASYKKDEETIRMSYKEYGEERLTFYEMLPGSPFTYGIKAAVFNSYRALTRNQKYLDDWAFLHFSRWVVFVLYLGFLLPLLNLAYATESLGAERESRTLLWLRSRPLPRWSVYLAKYLGVLPWCVGVSGVAFVMICITAGELGRKAMATYWPAMLAGSVGFASLFHLLGAVLRRPAVVGLVYVFFYETLIASLPGSLKQFSLSYYIRSMFYNSVTGVVSAVQPESLDLYAPVDSASAWTVITIVSVVCTLAGMYLFGRQEPKDEP